MKKHFLLFLISFLSFFDIYAQTKLVLHQKNGDKIEISLIEKPIARYENKELIITTNSSVCKFPINSIDSLTHYVSSTRIDEVCTNGENNGSSFIHDINGHLVKEIPEREPIIISTLPRGIYIIKNNSLSYKVLKK